MESVYQDSVTEFDLNLFEQATNARTGTPLTQCPISRKLGVARLKEKIKGVSQVIHKAKNTNEILLEVQKELLVTKQELEETRKLLFEKNEEHKIVCDEHSAYFQKATEYSKEIQDLKERIKQFESIDYDAEMKNKVINGYSEQVKGLQTEVDILSQEKKRQLKQDKIAKLTVEKHIARLLKDFVLPTTKVRTRWLTSIIKQYLPDIHKEDNEDNKYEKLEDPDDNGLEEEVRVPMAQIVAIRNSSSDADVGSVDTGRASSLEFSDGEKSFHSPNYCMDDPHSIITICKKCEVPKKDGSTSPISNLTDSVVTRDICKCSLISRKNACTSPIPFQMIDTGVNTSFDYTPINVMVNTQTNNKQQTQNDFLNSNTCLANFNGNESGYKQSSPNCNKSKDSIKLKDVSIFDSDDNDETIDDHGSPASSPLTLDFNEVTNDAVTNPCQNNYEIKIQNACQTDYRNSETSEKQVHTDPVENPDLTTIKIQITAASDSENEEEMYSGNISASPCQETSTFSPICDDATSSSMISCKEAIEPLSQAMSNTHSLPKISCSNQIIQEKQCLELNNSTNSRSDTEDDTEVQRILAEMRLQHNFISPIPASPQSVRSPKISMENNDAIQSVARTLNKQIELLRKKVKDVFTPFVETLPQCMEQIPRLFADGEQNEELLRNLILNPTTATSKKGSLEKEKKTLHKKNHSDSVESNTVLIDMHEGEENNCDKNSNAVNNFNKDNVKQSRNWHSETYESCEKISLSQNVINRSAAHFVNNTLHVVPSVIAGKSPKSIDSQTHKSTHVLGTHETDDISDVISIGNTLTGAADSRNNLAYEGQFSASDVDDITVINAQIQVHTEDAENGNKNKHKTKRLTKLERLRQKMKPKGKIKKDFTKSNRKPHFKPTPIKTVTPKKKVTASDTAASLNDKSVYEKAVQVIAAERISKSKNKLRNEADYENRNKIDETNRNYTASNNLQKCIVSQNFGKPVDVTESELPSVIATMKSKRKDTPLELNCAQKTENSDKCYEDKEHNAQALQKELRRCSVQISRDENVTKLCQEENRTIKTCENTSASKSDKVPAKRTRAALSSSFSEDQDIKRRRRSPVDKTLNSIKKSSVTEPESPRILRSSSISIKKELESKASPVVARTRAGLRSMNKQTPSDKVENTSVNELSTSNRKQKILGQTFTEKVDDSPIISLTSKKLKMTDTTFSVKANDTRITSPTDRNPKKVEKSVSVKVYDLPITPPTRRKLRITDKSPSIEVNDPPITTPTSKKLITTDKTVFDEIYDTLITSPTRKNLRMSDKTVSDEVNDPPFTSPTRRNLRMSDKSVSDEVNDPPFTSPTRRNLRMSDKTLSDEVNDPPFTSPTRRNLRMTDKTVSDEVNDPPITSPTSKKLRMTDKTLSDEVNDLPITSPASRKLKTTDKTISDELNDPPIKGKKRISRVRQTHSNTNNCNENIKVPVAIQGITANSLFQNNNMPSSKYSQDVSLKMVDHVISYADLDILSNDCHDTPEILHKEDVPNTDEKKDSLLFQTIQKYALKKLKIYPKTVPETKIKEVSNTLETSISAIVELPPEACRAEMKYLVATIQAWDAKLFLLGLLKFLSHPDRKLELFNKCMCPPAPPMTKKEQILLFVIDELQKSYEYKNIVTKILDIIEYELFALNKTQEFDVVEVMSHLYAVLCRSYQKISRLRLFMVDAMYCLQLKAVILVQQCFEVWSFVLPLGHMGLAKCPLVICLVYLLHFYKCKDEFNRVQSIRNTLRWKYNYDLTDWTETKILDRFKTAVAEINDNSMERKILRLSLLILAKRNGAAYCHKNIIKNMLQPLIEDNTTSESAKCFALSLLGPLIKPFPANMKVHHETIVNYQLDLLEKTNSQKMQEAIISSLFCLDKNNEIGRLHRFLVAWTPKRVSLEFQLTFRDYVRSKTVDTWKYVLSRQV